MPPRQQSGRIEALDGLRGVAALLVLFHHMLLMLPDFANVEWHIPGAVPHGFVEWVLLRTPFSLLWAGQERALLFFVLSGFVLSMPWLNGRPEPYGQFLLTRLCRIYPPYIAAMTLAATGSMALGGHVLPAASIYFNTLGWVFQPSWATAPSVAFILNTPASEYMNEAVWSLVWEVRVAIIFPLLVVPIVRWGIWGAMGAMGATLVLRHVAGVLVSARMSAALNVPQETFYYAEYFILGATIAAFRAPIAAWFGRRRRGTGLVAFLAGLLICWCPSGPQHDRIVGVGASVIIAAIAGDHDLRSWFSVGWLLWLGRLSYSLYLTHLMVVMVIVIVSDGRVSLWACAGVLPISIGLAALFRSYVEVPSIRCARHALRGLT